MDQFHLAQDKNQQQFLVKIAVNIWVAKRTRNFLGTRAGVVQGKRIMLHGISYRGKDPNYHKYEQQFSKELSQADETKYKVKIS